MVAVRCDTDELAVALTVTVPLFEPEDGEAVSQDVALLLTVHLVSEVMDNSFCPLAAEKLKEFVDTVKDAADCVTLMVCMMSPPVTVMVAVRCEADVFPAAVTVTVPFSEPEFGETVSQDVSLLLTVQFTLDVTVKDLSSPENENSSEFVDNSNSSLSQPPVIHSTPREINATDKNLIFKGFILF